MKLSDILPLLSAIKGCTFASLDAVTMSRGIRREVMRENVILFARSDPEKSGYSDMVRRRLLDMGADPDSFVLQPLPWGEKDDHLPLIRHRENVYLQTILNAPGEVSYFIGDKKIAAKDVPWLEPKAPHQGLPSGRQVIVQTYNLENITVLRLLGEEIV